MVTDKRLCDNKNFERVAPGLYVRQSEIGRRRAEETRRRINDEYCAREDAARRQNNILRQ